MERNMKKVVLLLMLGALLAAGCGSAQEPEWYQRVQAKSKFRIEQRNERVRRQRAQAALAQKLRMEHWERIQSKIAYSNARRAREERERSALAQDRILAIN